MMVNECMNELCVYVWVKNVFGKIDVVSMYQCQWSSDIELYLEYIDSIFRYASGTSVWKGPDTNGILWHIKYECRECESELQGQIVEKFFIQRGVTMFNEPRE